MVKQGYASSELFGEQTPHPRPSSTCRSGPTLCEVPAQPGADAGELTVTLCTACGRWVAMPALTPEVSDETAWALQTEQHWPECPWVLTRGYHIATERAGGERGC